MLKAAATVGRDGVIAVETDVIGSAALKSSTILIAL